MIYPTIVDSGSILRSRDETGITLLACAPVNALATGDVRRCTNKYKGIVTVKLMH
jgi:hypothetical protein